MPDATYVGAGMPCGNCGNPLTPGQPHKCGRTPDFDRRLDESWEPSPAASPDERLREAVRDFHTRQADSAGSRDIIASLTRKSVVPKAGAFEPFVRLVDAEAAVRAAADTRTREIVTAIREDADDEWACAIVDGIAVWLVEDELAAVRGNLADLLARRFPVSDCDTTSTNEAAGETPTSATPDR